MTLKSRTLRQCLRATCFAVSVLVAGCAGLETGSSSKSLNVRGGELVEAGAYTQAEPILQQALIADERATGSSSLQTSTVLYNLGRLYRLQGRYTEAEPLLRRALLIQDGLRTAATSFLPGTLNEYGYVLLLEGRYADAEPLFRRALSLQERSLAPGSPAIANSAENLGYLFRLQGRYEQARNFYERARSIREKALGLDSPQLARTLTNIGVLQVLQGRPREAEPLEQRALQMREKTLGARHPAVADSLYDLGTLYRSERRFAESRAALERGILVQTAATGPNHPILATKGYAGLAQLYLDMGNTRDALLASDQATEILKRQLADGRAERSTAAMTERRLYRDLFLQNIALTQTAGASLGQDPVASSIVTAQYAGALTAGQAIARMAAQFAAGNGTLAGDIRRLHDLRDRWQQLDDQLLKEVGSSAAPPDGTSEASLRASLESTDREITALADKIGREFPEYSEITSSKAVTLASVQKLLGPDEAMVVYLVGPNATWLWAVRDRSASLHRLDISAGELAIEVNSLRALLDPDTNAALKPFPTTRASRLYQRILRAAEPTIRGAHHLLIVPDGALDSLPLGVLVTEPPAHDPVSPADHRAVHWLASDYAISVLPSVASLHALRASSHASRASSPFFGVGDPAIGSAQGGGTRGTVPGLGTVIAQSPSPQQLRMTRDPGETTRALGTLPALPETSVELKAIAEIMGASTRDLLLGRRANETDLVDAPLGKYRVIEFATHGLKRGDLGLDEPALVLTPTGRSNVGDDGLLTASKISALKLDADWVVLSACNTASSGDSDADGFSTLARAFFHAGARSVLVSHWSVPSVPTVKLTTGAFRELAKAPSIGRAEALRRSMMAMLDPSNPAEFAHPLAWAPFSLAGEGRR